MGRFVESSASFPVMNHAWRFYRNDKGLWEKNLPMAEMQRDVILHIGQLMTDLASGSYRPAPLRCYEMEKADQKTRTICVSPIRDRLAQRAVLTVLEPLGEKIFHKNSFGFRPNRSVDNAINKVREYVRDGFSWLLDADIKSCFDMIPHETALLQLFELTKDKELNTLVRYWLTNVPPEHRVGGPGRGLPQGMVLSPFLCNLHLHVMDEFLDKRKVLFVRFADDFVLLAKNAQVAYQYRQIVTDILGKLGLELHPDKTQIIQSSRNHLFLGKRLPNSQKRFNPFAVAPKKVEVES